MSQKKHLISDSFIPEKEVVDIVLTSGASCPDSVVESVLKRILEFFPNARSVEDVYSTLK